MNPLEPFLDHAFMARALAGGVALAVSAPPLGVMLVLRRMSLVGDALSHAVLPGVAFGFLLAGSAPVALMIGGFAAGLLVAIAAASLARGTGLREDSAFAGFTLVSLALGVTMISASGTRANLTHLLFGSVLGVDDLALGVMAGAAAITLVVLAIGWRPLVLDAFDPGFLVTAGIRAARWHLVFMVLVVLNLVAAFQAMGTLMAVGLMILPAVGARFCSGALMHQVTAAVAIALAAVVAGLLGSYHLDLPGGPAIVLAAGAAALALALFGPHESLAARALLRPHRVG